MQNLTIFKNENLGEIRVIFIDNEPLFCLADICKILGLTTPSKVANAIKSEFELGELSSYSFDTGYGVKDFTMITEAQLYFVLMRSDKAKEFMEWIDTEVFSNIKNCNLKQDSQPQELPQEPKSYGELLLEAGRLALENERLLAQAKENQPKIEALREFLSAYKDFISEVDKILDKLDKGD